MGDKLLPYFNATYQHNFVILPRYDAERSHEIATACANQCNICRRSGWCFIAAYEDFLKKYSFIRRLEWTSQLANVTAPEHILELGSVLDASLSVWNEELSAGSNQTLHS